MAESGDQLTVIGADTQIKGEMVFEKNARVLGKVEGKINAKSELTIADGALAKAEIEAANLIVDGTIEGDIKVGQKASLNAKSSIKGDLVATKLVVAEGASFVGHVSVGPEAGKGRPASSDNAAAQQMAKLETPIRK